MNIEANSMQNYIYLNYKDKLINILNNSQNAMQNENVLAGVISNFFRQGEIISEK
jgi:hypothetical protein